MPGFASFFSGAPVLYPPLGALADTIGGLAAARLLSAGLMVAATWLLHRTARQIFGARAALLAAGLFAGLASTQFLGAFATYDALALFLLALATWLGVRAGTAGRAGGWSGPRLAVTAAAVLALASAAKYAAAIFDPVVLAVAAGWAWHERGARAGARTAIVMFWTLLALLGAALAAGGAAYWHGVTSTTLARPGGSYPAAFLWFATVRWTGVVIVLALIGAAVAVADRQRPRALVAVTLAAAALLAPAEQARIHTYTSLFKHDGYGAWFGCAAAGYALASLARVIPAAKAAAAGRVAAATVALAAGPAVPVAAEHYGWPPAGPMIAVMGRVLTRQHGPVLADDRGNVLDYYLRRQLGTDPVAGTWFWSYTDPRTGRRLTGQAAFADAIRHRYFAVVVLTFWDTYRTDLQIEHDLTVHPREYRFYDSIPYQATGGGHEYLIYVRRPGPARRGAR